MSKRLLITGGCSFSECVSHHLNTWPRQLIKYLPDCTHVSKATGSQGNGLISRGVIYSVTEALKTRAPENILVGIMWSGPDRWDFYMADPSIESQQDVMQNPTGFTGVDRNWIIVNHNWKIQQAKQYYGNFYDPVGALIYSYEHILRTQWFLKQHKIPYFMTTYMNTVLREKDHRDTKHLYEQIDLEHFLPVAGCYEWCRDQSGISFVQAGDDHPTSDQHQAFTEQIIVPWLKNKGYINDS